jgi:hypothetical protein
MICRLPLETEIDRAVETSTRGIARGGSCSGTSSSCSLISIAPSASAKGRRVESAGEIPDLGAGEAEAGDMIRSIFCWVALKAEGGLRVVLLVILSLAGGWGRDSVWTVRRGRTGWSCLWLSFLWSTRW